VEMTLRTLFESPTVADLAASLDELRRAGAGTIAPPIGPVSRDSQLPLSYAQRRVWFFDQLEPGMAFYNLPAAVRMKGRLNVAALEQALNELVRRHESLRTRYVAVDGRPVQVIDEFAPTPLALTDLTCLPADEREEEAKRLAGLEARRPFNLARGPLMRTGLLRISEEDHVLLVTLHRINSDAWSQAVFVGDMATLYTAFSEGRESPLAELPLQFADFAAWQNEWFQSADYETHLSYWKRQLAGAPAALNLPADRPRASVEEFTRGGGLKRFEPSQALFSQLEAFNRQEGVTTFITLLALFNVVLWHHSGQEDIVVGFMTANRNRRETENLIGYLINMVPLRTNLAGDPTFRELLVRVRETALEAYAHEDIPFDKLAAEALPERDPNRRPLVQAIFGFKSDPIAPPKLPRLDVSFFEQASAGMSFDTIDLTLDLEGSSRGMYGDLAYSRDLFDDSTMARFIGDYERLLQHVVAQPDSRLSELKQSLEEAERRETLAKQEEFKQSKRRAFKNVRPKPVGTPAAREGEPEYELTTV
ncbi:MAG TPA: condensation domain-containing protein, partial [Pyrinomonadaceae bacterium]|nr:condensation domain-containing protein [Pyrinomonadaceae bacterium]